MVDLSSSSFAFASFNKKSTVTKLQHIADSIAHLDYARSQTPTNALPSSFEKYIIYTSALFSN